jgi:hypothetical protein
MDEFDLISQLHRRFARAAVGASTARGMGRGTVATGREYLSGLKLERFSRCRTSTTFKVVLNNATKECKKMLPNHSWGAARKFINIFLRDTAYNRFLCNQYRLTRMLPWLEVPLDSYVAHNLRKDQKLLCNSKNGPLPRWKTIIRLKEKTSKHYQDVAIEISEAKNTERIHLDLEYWHKEEKPLRISN